MMLRIAQAHMTIVRIHLRQGKKGESLLPDSDFKIVPNRFLKISEHSPTLSIWGRKYPSSAICLVICRIQW